MDDADLFEDPRITEVGLLFEAANGLRRKMEQVWAEHGLSSLDFTALMRLSRSPGNRLRLIDLAAQSALSTSGVTRLVDRLERNGLARREPDPCDRRSFYAVLTAAGAARLAQVMRPYLEVIEQWFVRPLTDEQRRSLEGPLRALRDASFPDAARVSEKAE